MANRFWVGGTGNWNGTAGTNWALTTGGVGGQAEPTAADDVFFDGASGANTITIITTVGLCNNISFAGFTGTMAGAVGVNISGGLTFSTTMTITNNASWTFVGTSLGNTITWAGKTLSAASFIFSGTGSWIFQDLYVGAGIFHSAGTIDMSLMNQSIGVYSNNSSSTARTLALASTTLTVTYTAASSGGKAWRNENTGLTITGANYTIKHVQNGTGRADISLGTDVTYKNFYCSWGSTGAIRFLDATMAITNLTFDTVGTSRAVSNANASTMTVGNIIVPAIGSGTLITWTSVTAATAWNITTASTLIRVNWLALRDSVATPASTLFAGTGSVDTSGNSGWVFTRPAIQVDILPTIKLT